MTATVPAVSPTAALDAAYAHGLRAWTWARTNGKELLVELFVKALVCIVVLSWLGVLGFALILLLVAATGTHLALTRQRSGIGTVWFVRRVWCVTGVVTLVPLLLVVAGLARPVTTSLWLLLGYVLIGRRIKPPEPPRHWHNTHEVISSALVKAGVYKAVELATVNMPGTAVTDDRGTRQTLTLPGRYWRDVEKAAPQLAAALGVPEQLVKVEHTPQQPADTFTLWVGTAQPTLEPRVSPYAAKRACRWDDPVVIGRDRDGGDVVINTFEANVLLAGIMGYGKTTAARPILAAFLLDPTATLYVLDGKGSVKDYGPVKPHAARFVYGTQEDAPEALADMLDDVLTVVRTRNGEPERERYDGVLLMLEELQDVRAGAEKALRERIDTALGRIIRMGRAVGVVVVISTQRPDVLDLPASIRNLISQQVALKLRSADYRLVLGDTPRGLVMPSERGEAILSVPAGHTAILTDAFPMDEWRQVCAKAVTAASYSEPVNLTKTAAAPDPDAPLTMQDVVLDILTTEGAMNATDVYTLLPEHLRPTSPVALGKAMGKWPQVSRIHTGKSRLWSANPADRKVADSKSRSEETSSAQLPDLAVAP